MHEYDYLYLKHHGILGQKWGVRRYQNPDGTLTPAGMKRYQTGTSNKVSDIYTAKGVERRLNDLDKARAFNVRYYNENTKAANTNKKWADKAKSKNSIDKYNKATQRRKEFQQYATINAEYIIKGYKETANLIEKLEKQGFQVYSKATPRDVLKGYEHAIQIGLNFIGALAGSPIIYLQDQTVVGKKYKVKEKEVKSYDNEFPGLVFDKPHIVKSHDNEFPGLVFDKPHIVKSQRK